MNNDTISERNPSSSSNNGKLLIIPYCLFGLALICLTVGSFIRYHLKLKKTQAYSTSRKFPSKRKRVTLNANPCEFSPAIQTKSNGVTFTNLAYVDDVHEQSTVSNERTYSDSQLFQSYLEGPYFIATV